LIFSLNLLTNGCMSFSLPSVPPDNVSALPKNTGNIQGLVYLRGFPLRSTSVVVYGNRVNGNFSFNRNTLTGNPGNAPTVPEPPAVHQSDPRITVLHDFGDKRGPVLAERWVRLFPQGSGDGRLLFLRSGEYFLEGVPAGLMTVQVEYDPQPDMPESIFGPGLKPYIRPIIQVNVEAGKTVVGKNITFNP
jgi:hypothetical protein